MDEQNGKRRSGTSITIAASIGIAVVTSLLLAQSWAKDAGHEAIKIRQDSTEKVLEKDTSLIHDILVIQGRMITTIESIEKRLDKLEE